MRRNHSTTCLTLAFRDFALFSTAIAAVLAYLLFPSAAFCQPPDKGDGTFLLAKTIRDKQKMPVTQETDTDDLIWALENHEYTAPRRMAAEFLGDRKATKAIPSLLKALKDPEYVVQKAAAEALTKVGDETLFEPLIQNFDDPRFHVREYSVYVVGQLARGRDTREIMDVITALKRMANDESGLVRDQVYNALLEIGSNTCESIFIQGMKDTDPAVRRHSANALGKFMGREAEDALVSAYKVETNQETKQAISTALGEFGTENALHALVSTMYKEPPTERAKITQQLAESGSRESVDILSNLVVSDTSALVRTKAAEGLLKAMNPASVPALAEALKDKVASVKIPASQALVELADDSVTEELVNAMGDTNDTVSENAARALVRLHNPKVIPDLMLLLDHADSAVVDRATAVLEELTYKPYGTDVKRWKLWYEENYDGDIPRENFEPEDAS